MDLQKSGYIRVFWHAETEFEAYLCLKLEVFSRKKDFSFSHNRPLMKKCKFYIMKKHNWDDFSISNDDQQV